MDATLLLEDFQHGFLSSFISKGLKTNQLEVNTDEKTLRPIARLKEPRDLFALPKDKDNDCSQQAARWPIECQVLDERINHIPYNPAIPEPYNVPTGLEPKPRPVGEENGIVVYNYNPVSAVNYDKCKPKADDSDGSDSDSSSSESRGSSPEHRQRILKNRFAKMLKDCRSSSNSNDENDDDDDDDEEEDEDEELAKLNSIANASQPCPIPVKVEDNANDNDIEDIWGSHSPPFSTSPIKLMINRVKVKQLQQETILQPLPVLQTARLEIFSRSSVGGAKYLSQVHPFDPNEYDGLWFESRFESGNLAKAVKITDSYYELYLRPDLYTSRSKQWFYFRVSRTKANMTYRFSIVNLVKSDSLYNDGMRPLMYSEKSAAKLKKGWSRCGENICYYRNEDENSNEEDEENWSYTLTFNVEFPNDDDVVYFAHSYPYTYTDLQDYLMAIQKHPIKSKFCKLRLLCRSLAGNNVYYLTVTAPSADEEVMKKKKAIVVSARVHPSETPSSWMMKGLMDFITGESTVAKRLRHKFIFKLVPMLNPDGVIVGNTRNSLTGKDLNRQYRTVIRETYPSIWYTKAMIKRLIDECGVAMYCDMHAHSRRQNIFVYGCENRRNPEKKLTEQVFPLMMHKNVADKFSFENCKFKIQRSKEGTGRIVVWMLGVTNSYTIEASFGGSSLGSRKGTHFSTGDYEHMGRAFCETLLDYCDENPNKERLRLKIIERLLKEGSSADEPLNIPLSDYSSDEGDTSSSSDNEGKADRFSDLEGPCCQPLRAPPCTPDAAAERRKVRMKKHHRSKSQYIVNRNHKKDQRIALDMPTTDPGSDLFYSTDEDPFPETELGIFDTVPKSRRYLLYSDLQRRYIYTIGDGHQRMPPELIVTPAERQAAVNMARGERDPSTDTARRTNSWHHVKNNSARSTTLKNLHYSGRSSNKDDQLLLPKGRLPLPLGQSDGFEVRRPKSRPLSWALTSVPRKEKKLQDDQKALLNACSQKLAAWQQEKDNRGQRQSKVCINNIGDRITYPKDVKKTSSREKRFIQKANHPGGNQTYLTKLSQNNYLLAKRSSGPTSSSQTTTNALDPFSSTASQRPANKFKTGGIVATAVQSNKKGRQRSVARPIAVGTIEPVATQTDNERSFARRVKSKLKKKKSLVSLKCKT